MDGPSFNGMKHQYGQAFGAPAEADEDTWAGRGFTAQVSAETLGEDDSDD